MIHKGHVDKFVPGKDNMTEHNSALFNNNLEVVKEYCLIRLLYAINYLFELVRKNS